MRGTLPAPGTPVGVLGGSISSGTGVTEAERYTSSHLKTPRSTHTHTRRLCLHSATSSSRYSNLLESTYKLKVHNRAVGSTGCAYPSFCLAELLPASLGLRWLLIEYGVNDGQFAFVHKESTIGGHTLNPQVSMERLLRRAMIEQPEAEPVFLYVCGPTVTICEGLFSSLARLLTVCCHSDGYLPLLHVPYRGPLLKPRQATLPPSSLT